MNTNFGVATMFLFNRRNMSNRVIYFEIPSANPDVNRQFYQEAFGWQFHQSGSANYWFAHTGTDGERGINGAVLQEACPQQPVINTIAVDDIDASITRIKEAGGRLVKPKKAIPAVGWLAFFTDPDDNIFGILQEDSSAGIVD
jgi:predicted enzyme related to lactoylglutathione lyase